MTFPTGLSLDEMEIVARSALPSECKGLAYRTREQRVLAFRDVWSASRALAVVTELCSLRERVRVLEAERDEARKCYEQMNNALIQCRDDLAQEKARAEAAEHRAREMEEALRPFATVTVLPTGQVVGLERHWFSDAARTLRGYAS